MLGKDSPPLPGNASPALSALIAWQFKTSMCEINSCIYTAHGAQLKMGIEISLVLHFHCDDKIHFFNYLKDVGVYKVEANRCMHGINFRTRKGISRLESKSVYATLVRDPKENLNWILNGRSRPTTEIMTCFN